MRRNVVVVGAGPAGLSAGLQLKRLGVDVVVLERYRVGGLLHNANLVENYLGTGSAICGPELASRMAWQVKNLELDIRIERVQAVVAKNGRWETRTNVDNYQSSAVVVASGTVAKNLNWMVMDVGICHRVFYEVCDLSDVMDKQIGVIGAGDAAFDYALNLAKRGNKVVIMNRGTESKALRLLRNRVEENADIEYHTNVQVEAVQEAKDSQIAIELMQNNKLGTYTFDYLLIAVGREPGLDFLPDRWRNCGTASEAEGLFFSGDVSNGIYRQAAVAAGDGLRTAMKVHEFLQG